MSASTLVVDPPPLPETNDLLASKNPVDLTPPTPPTLAVSLNKDASNHHSENHNLTFIVNLTSDRLSSLPEQKADVSPSPLLPFSSKTFPPLTVDVDISVETDANDSASIHSPLDPPGLHRSPTLVREPSARESDPSPDVNIVQSENAPHVSQSAKEASPPLPSVDIQKSDPATLPVSTDEICPPHPSHQVSPVDPAPDVAPHAVEEPTLDIEPPPSIGNTHQVKEPQRPSVDAAQASDPCPLELSDLYLPRPPPAYDLKQFSLKGVKKLEEFIPDDLFPDDLLVHDRDNLTRKGNYSLDIPTRYVRVFPMSSGESEKHTHAYCARKPGVPPRVAHLYLSDSNALGSGHHSEVYRAPLRLRLDPESDEVSSVSVVAKLCDRRCGAHHMLSREAQIYNVFPRELMEDTVVPPKPVPQPLPVSASSEAQPDKDIAATPTETRVSAEPVPQHMQVDESSEAHPADKNTDISTTAPDTVVPHEFVPQPMHVDACSELQSDKEGVVDESTIANHTSKTTVASSEPVPQPMQIDESQPAKVTSTTTAPDNPAESDNTAMEVDPPQSINTSACESRATESPSTPSSDGDKSKSNSEPQQPAPAPVIKPALVPKFYGYYCAVEDDGRLLHRRHHECNEESCCKVMWPTSILLVEECGKPVCASSLSIPQRRQCLQVLGRLHAKGFCNGSAYMRNMLVQPGPLSVPPEERTMDNPSFRIIDFGRALTSKSRYFDDTSAEDYDRASSELHLSYY